MGVGTRALRVRIDELHVRGVPRREARRFAAAFESALGRSFSEADGAGFRLEARGFEEPLTIAPGRTAGRSMESRAAAIADALVERLRT